MKKATFFRADGIHICDINESGSPISSFKMLSLLFDIHNQVVLMQNCFVSTYILRLR
jgi:hypothetical protein